ncbi:MAG: IclR family transcriptional regulator [Chloroflexi bacterium]|nr:IclR family transcriptional regulator [Chloroflexota bacterium]
MFPVLDASLSGNHQEVLLPMEAWPTRPSRRLSGSVGKAFQILAAFSVQRPELTASQIAAEIGMDRSTTHRFLTTLLDIGAVVRDPATRRYGLGLPLLGYACVLSNTLEVRRIALSHLHELHRDLEATVSLGVRDGAEVVLVERQSLAGPWVPPGGIEIGFRFPMHASATGLAILAFLAPDEIEGALRGLELKARTPHTLGTPAESATPPRTRSSIYVCGPMIPPPRMPPTRRSGSSSKSYEVRCTRMSYSTNSLTSCSPFVSPTGVFPALAASTRAPGQVGRI